MRRFDASLQIASFCPKTNFLVGRSHKTLNVAINAHVQSNEQIWLAKLPYLLLVIRN